MSDSSPELPDSFLNRNLSEIVRGKASAAFAEVWLGRQIDSYRLDSLIGSGTHGLVFRAYRTHPYHETVAIKLFPSLQGLAKRSIRFREECQALADLDHRHIARILTAGLTDDETPYLVMPLVDGMAIDEYVARNSCDSRQVAELVRQLTNAVAFAHQSNVIHCDLKPDNILVDESGSVTVTDFGLAIRIDRMDQLTQSPSWTPGTVGYCAPEILTSSGEASPAVDIYSVGAVLYKLMTGEAPTRDERWLDAIVTAIARDPEPVRSMNSDVLPGLAAICDRCLARDPQERYESAAQLESELEAFLGKNARQRTSSWRTRWIPAFALFVVTVLAALSVIVSYFGGQSTVVTQAALQPAEPLPSAERLPEEEVARILERIKVEFLRPGAKDPADPGDFETLFQSLQEASAELEALLERAPDNKKVRESAAVGYFLLGRAAHWVKEDQYADASLARSEEMFRRLHRDYPDGGYMFDFFHTILVQSTRAPVRERRDLLLLALGVIEGLNDSPEENLDYQDALACTWVLLAQVYMLEGEELFDFEKAAPYAQKSFDLARRISQKPGSRPIHRKHIMTSASILSDIARFRGAFDESIELAETAYVEAGRLDKALGIADTRFHLYNSTWKYVVALRDVGRLNETNKYLLEAEQLAEELKQLNWPDSDKYPSDMKAFRQSIETLRK